MSVKEFDKKLSCCSDSRSYCLRRIRYRQTIKPVSITSWRMAGTHDPIQRV